MAIIGETVRAVCLFCQSVRGASEATALSGGKLKSVQTIMNWIKWMGFLHPARIPAGAGVTFLFKKFQEKMKSGHFIGTRVINRFARNDDCRDDSL